MSSTLITVASLPYRFVLTVEGLVVFPQYMLTATVVHSYWRHISIGSIACKFEAGENCLRCGRIKLIVNLLLCLTTKKVIGTFKMFLKTSGRG